MEYVTCISAYSANYQYKKCKFSAKSIDFDDSWNYNIITKTKEKNIMKKLLLLLTVCFTLTSCASAGTKTESDSGVSSLENINSVVTDNVLESGSHDELKNELLQLTNCYKKEDFSLPDGMAEISGAQNLSGGNIMVYLSTKDFNGHAIYKANADFSEFTLFEYEKPEEMQNFDVAYDEIFFNPDGTACSLVTLENHSGITIPDEPDENFDYDSYYTNCITTYMICTYDNNGKLLTKSEFEYPEEAYDDYGYIRSGIGTVDGDSMLIPFEDGSIHRLSADGTMKKIYELENPNDYVYTQAPRLYHDRDGKIIVMRYDTTDSHDSNDIQGTETVVNFFEFDGEKLGDVIYSCKDYNLTSSVVFGRGDYRLFVSTYDGLVGIKDDGTTDIALDWLASSIESMYVIPCGENDFIGMEWNSEIPLIKLVPRDMSEFANIEIITVSNCNITIVNNFNNSSDKYMVKVVNYPYDDNNAQLNMDIISGNAPDIICDLDYSTYLNYRNKGVFTDLYELMDNELSKDMLMPNVVTALENHGKLYSLCTTFDINTLVAKAKNCNKENWTFDDMLALYDSSTAEHLYDGETKLDMFRRMFYTMNDLIDYENVTCNFDSPEFIQLLEFCNRFVDTVDAPQKWDDPESWSVYMSEKYHWFGNDKTLVEPLNFVNLSQYNLLKYTQSNGEDLTLVGYPSNNGKGGRIEPMHLMSITEKCENKQGAWEFMKFYILSENKINVEEYQYNYSECIPVLADSFSQAMTAEMSTQHSAGGEEYPAYTQKDVDMLTDYIMSCDTIGTVLDKDIVSVCEEEAGLYFAGEQTAEESAKLIQNRVSVLISERN